MRRILLSWPSSIVVGTVIGFLYFFLFGCAALGGDQPADPATVQQGVDTVATGAGVVGTALGGPAIGALVTSLVTIGGAFLLKRKAQPKA